MKFTTIINNILTLKSICLVSNPFGNKLLNIYISGPYLQEVHDVKLKAEKFITPRLKEGGGRVRAKTLPPKEGVRGSREAVGGSVSDSRTCLFFPLLLIDLAFLAETG